MWVQCEALPAAEPEKKRATSAVQGLGDSAALFFISCLFRETRALFQNALHSLRLACSSSDLKHLLCPSRISRSGLMGVSSQTRPSLGPHSAQCLTLLSSTPCVLNMCA